MSGIEWRYLPGGKVKHALTDTSHAGAACGVSAWGPAWWHGTGTQLEYETVEALRPRKTCCRRLGLSVEAATGLSGGPT